MKVRHYTPAATSLPELFPLFLTTDSDELQMIVRNDVQGLTSWLDAGGDANAADTRFNWQLLDRAVLLQRANVVRLLLDRGARVTESVRSLAGSFSGSETQALIRSASPTRPRRRGGSGRKSSDTKGSNRRSLGP